MGRDALKLEAPISVFRLDPPEWLLFWYVKDYQEYMANWHEQQARQIRRSAQIRLDKQVKT
jgi:hypothetical protein